MAPVGNHEHDPAEPLGTLLIRLRQQLGRSQLRVAEMLCAASGTATVTRHEVSRWERERRLPSGPWLRWLALVFEIPLGDLERAAAVSRQRREPTAPAPPPDPGPGYDTVDPDDGVVARLRRLDDLVGGMDLAARVNAALRAELAIVRRRPRRAGLVQVAELAQVAGWVNGDAGDLATARAAHRLAMRATSAAGDRALLGHLLGCAAHLSADPGRALALATAGVAEARRTGSPATRALALHRLAHAAARTGDRVACERALAAADTAFNRRSRSGPGAGPDWAYWLTEAEFAALTGRCYAVLRRPRLAVPLLTGALHTIRQPRSAAIYRGWLADAHLMVGDLDGAALLAGAVLLDAVRSGSMRAAARARTLHRHLLATGDGTATERYRRLAEGALPYLPRAVPRDQQRVRPGGGNAYVDGTG